MFCIERFVTLRMSRGVYSRSPNVPMAATISSRLLRPDRHRIGRRFRGPDVGAGQGLLQRRECLVDLSEATLGLGSLVRIATSRLRRIMSLADSCATLLLRGLD